MEGGARTMIGGEGEYRYEYVDGCEQLPRGWFHGGVSGEATDGTYNVCGGEGSEHPVIIYAQEGKYLDSWGDATMFPRPHGITIVDGILYLADDTDHTVRKTTLDGNVLMTLGKSG